MGERLTKLVALVGMMGTGKTAVGKVLAQQLGVPFLDSDQEIERAAGRTIAEIFERDGETFFRERETRVVERLLSGGPAILSTGGGTFMSARNRDLIAHKGVSVCLEADLELLWSRVRQKTAKRPLLQVPDPKGTLKKIYHMRSPVYALADIVVETACGHSITRMAYRVKDALREAGVVIEGGET